ncbi:MAG: hypothetical protein PHI97_30815 [Desulfobulbus sp.]|nr:hypothetical protein [Desulfobulbus sp.]
MRTKLSKVEAFDWASIFAFLVFVGLTCYAYSNGRNVIASFALFLSVWALLIIVGRFLTRTAYLEGHVLRLIRKKRGIMRKAEILTYYEGYGSFDYILDSLKERNAVEEQGETIHLLEENIKSGFRNRLMIWATRRTTI